MDVSIIIVNYNTSSLLNRCVESILEKVSNIDFEIIIVDNGSNDCDLFQIESDRIRWINCGSNMGFGKANNIGVESAKGEKIFFLNPDTILINNAVKVLSDFLDNNPTCGACGGNLYDANLFPTHSFNRVFPGIIEELDQAFRRQLLKLVYGKSIMFNHSEIPIRVAFITGADLMVRKELFCNIGCFNPIFFMYYEDTELQYRITKSGAYIFNVPNARIIHLEGKSYKLNLTRETQILISRKKYLSLTHSHFYNFIANFNYKLYTNLALLYSSIRGDESLKLKFKQRREIINKIRDLNYYE